MAKIIYTEKEKSKGDSIDGVEAEYAGKTHLIEFYPGDTRDKVTKIAAISECLFLRIEDEAKKAGEPLPDKDIK